MNESRIENYKKTIKKTEKDFFIYMSFIAFCLITLFSITDKQLILKELTLQLPILNIGVPLIFFFIFGPLLCIVTYVNFIFNYSNTKKVFEKILKENKDGQIDDHSFIFVFEGKGKKIKLEFFQEFLLFFFIWISLPVIILLFSLKYVKTHELIGIIIFGILLLISIVITMFLYHYNFCKKKDIIQIKKEIFEHIHEKLVNESDKTLLSDNYMIDAQKKYYILSADITDDIIKEIKLILRKTKYRSINKTCRFLLTIIISIGLIVYFAFFVNSGLKGNKKSFFIYPGFGFSNVVDLSYIKFKEEKDNDLKYCGKYTDLQLQGANLEGADLSKLILRNGNFKNANFKNANLTGSDLSESNLEKADFSNITILKDINFQKTKLKSVKFNNAVIILCEFNNSNLLDARFNDSTIIKSNFQNTTMYGANFFEAKIWYSNFQLGKLSLSNFSSANMFMCNFDTSICKCCDFESSTLAWDSFTGAKINNSNFKLDDNSYLNLYDGHFNEVEVEKYNTIYNYIKKYQLNDLTSDITKKYGIKEKTYRLNLYESLTDPADTYIFLNYNIINDEKYYFNIYKNKIQKKLFQSGDYWRINSLREMFDIAKSLTEDKDLKDLFLMYSKEGLPEFINNKFLDNNQKTEILESDIKKFKFNNKN